MATSWLLASTNLTVLLLVAPFITGLIRWSKARLQLRHGPDPLQPYRDLWKLWRTPPPQLAIPSWIFGVAPYITLATVAAAATMLPSIIVVPTQVGTGSNGTGSGGDLVLLIYLLSFARFTLGLAGMDSGSSFAHMGSSRSAFMQVLLEPGLILALAGLGLFWGTSDLPTIVLHAQALGLQHTLTQVPLVLIGVSLSVAALAEAERLPFQNPTTHLELTMAERAIHIEYAGRQLAAIETAEALKKVILLTLLIDVLVPAFIAPLPAAPLALAFALIAYFGKLAVAVILLALWELMHGQYRLRVALRPAALARAAAICAIVLLFISHLPLGGA